jgi:outer membrane protein insertion porin family
MRLPLPFVVLALMLAGLVAFALPVFGEEAPAVSAPEAAASSAAPGPEGPGPGPTGTWAPEPTSPAAPTTEEGASQPAPAQQGAAQPFGSTQGEPSPGAEAAPSLPAELVGEQKEPSLSVPPPPEIPPPIVGVDIVGNERVARDDILKAIKSQPGGQYSEAQVKRDVEAIRSLGSFQRVWQESVSVENGVNLLFHVIENPVITDIQFEGNRELTREQLLKVMKTQPGQIYNARVLLEDGGRDGRIERLYQSRGYILAMVLAPSMSDAGVLTIPIAEGVIESVKITGNTHTKTYAIRRYIRTREGETYNAQKVARDVGRLNSLGWFETVRQDAEMGTEAGKVMLIVTVVERKRTGMASVGGGYSSVQGLVGLIDLTKSNVGGNGQQVSIRGEFGGRTSYELGYQHPWVMTPETRLSTGIYDRLILREAFITDDEGQHSILYDERRNGGNLTLGRPLSDSTQVFLGVRSDDISISDLSPEEEALLKGGEPDLPAAFQPRDVRSVTLAAVNDTRSDLYNPRQGFYQRFSAEFAGVFGGVDFNKYVSDSRRFFPMGSRNVVAVRLLAGAVTGEAPYLERFLIGGSESLRGFRTDRFVGTHMAIVNTEYRFPVSENLLGVVFVDVGDAWGGTVSSEGGLEGLVHESFTAHLGYGVGVRVQTPIGALRLDLGFSEEGTETHFGVRHMF